MQIPTLNENLINKRLSAYPGKVFVYDKVNSTQTQAKRLWQTSYQPLTVVANVQTSGYGRNGRAFYSPANTGLYFSIVFPLTSSTSLPTNIGLLTTGMTVVVGNNLQKYYPNIDFKYKWVNDIYLAQKKVCGIIAELVQHHDQQAIIIGVGINLMTTTFPNELANKANSINPSSVIDRNLLLADILNSTTDFFANYQTGYFLPTYRQKSLVLGRQITVHYGQHLITGTAVAIDNTGRLVLKDQLGKRYHFASGEVTKVIV